MVRRRAVGWHVLFGFLGFFGVLSFAGASRSWYDSQAKKEVARIFTAIRRSGIAPQEGTTTLVNHAESTDTPEALSAAERQELRDQFYNATIIKRLDAHEHLARFRVRPDGAMPRFEAGQYVALGLGYWESRIAPSQPEDLPAKKLRKVIRRAYSIGCPMLGEDGRLASCDDVDYLEFYITLVRFADSIEHPAPAFTPRLFMLGEGDRLAMAPKIVGTYTLAGIGPDDHVLMLGTGTGEAPHNAMAARLLQSGHRGRIVIGTTARYLRDLAYDDAHAQLMAQHPNFVYLPLTTRERYNTDPSDPQYIGKEYLQEMLTSGKLEERAGFEISPQTTHVFLCGNPAMIGYIPPGAPPLKEPGMLQLFEQRGFEHKEHQPGIGTIRFEKYW